MKYYILIPFLIFLFINARITAQVHYFQTGYGTAYDDEGFALCEADSSGHIVAGYSLGFNAGANKDIYIVKFDKDGRVKWSSHYDDGDNETGVGILKYPTNEFFVMSVKENPKKTLLSKITSNGDFLWTRTIPSPPTTFLTGNEMILLPNGNLAFCGLRQQPNGSAVDSNGVIIITDTAGNIIQSKDYNLGRGTSFNDMIISNDNKLAICGISTSTSDISILLVKADFNGDSIWTKKYPFVYQYLYVTSILQYPSGKYVIGGSEPPTYANTFLHGVTSDGDSILFHKSNFMICDQAFDMKYSSWDNSMIIADGYYNFRTHFGYLYSDSIGNMFNNIVPYFNIPSYAWDYAVMVTEAREIVVKENVNNPPTITFIGGQMFSGHGGMDVGIVTTEGDGNLIGFGEIIISAKTNKVICPGDSVLIVADSNIYSTYHWINAGWPGIVDLGIYNDSIWVSDSGYYYLVGMDSDSGIIISNEVRVDVIDTTPPVITHTGSLNFCNASGQTLSLLIQMKPGSHYQWYKDGNILTGDTISNLNVTTSGIYTCRRINICGSFESMPVNVNAQWGTVPFINYQNVGYYRPWCNEIHSQELSIYPPSVGTYHYQWFHNYIAIPNSDFTTIPIMGNGSYFCVVSNACATDSSYTIIVYTQSQPTISSSNFICMPGDSTGLTLSYPTSLIVYSYQWSFNGNPISGATSYLLTATQPGTYSVSLSTNECSNSPIQSSPFTLSVSSGSLPQLNMSCNDTLICFKQNTQLNLNSSTYTNYWYRNDTLIFSSHYPALTTSKPGTYYSMNKNLCDSSYSDTINIHQYPYQPLDLGSDMTICNTDTVLLDAGNGFNSYIWNSGDTTQSIWVVSTSSSIDTVNYIIHITDSNSCTNSDTIQIIFDICSGIIENNFNHISVYPNPFSLTTQIFSKDITYGSNIEIYNSIGELLFLKYVDSNPVTLDVPFLKSGVYICIIQTARGKYRSKLILE